jgi:hypothetical protein
MLHSSKKIIKRGGYDLHRDTTTQEIGDGYFCEEIADKIGLLNSTNDNPNRLLVKYVAEKLFLKPSGSISGEIIHQSNGSMCGVHPFVKNKYNDKHIDMILGEVNRKKRWVGGNIFQYDTKKFKIRKDE